MKEKLLAMMAVSTMVLAGCDANMNSDARTVAGVAGGAAAGLILADELEADDDWRLIAALAGASAGTLVAQNTAQQTCAYARGDGTYYTAPCP